MFTRIAVKPRFASRLVFNTFRPFSGETRIRFNQNIDKEKAEGSQLKVYRKLKFDYLHGLPYDIAGTHSVPKLDERSLIETFFSSKKIDETSLTSKFHDMVVDLYTAIAEDDLEKVASLTEKRFGEKVTDSMKTTDTSLEFFPDETSHVDRESEDQSYLFDKIFEKGVYFDREKNDNNYDYLLDQTQEGEGIRTFQHKYFAGYDTHYYLANCADEVDDRKSKYKFEYETKIRSNSMVLRVYGVFKNLGKFASHGADLTSEKYTGNHMVVFENQLQGPPIIALSDPNVEKWVKRHKIDHSNWRITDIDNYMKGNSFFKKMGDSSDFHNFAEKIKEAHIPKTVDPRNPISKYSFKDNVNLADPTERQKLVEFQSKQFGFRGHFEPASNREFEEENKKRLAEEAKKITGKKEDEEKERRDKMEYMYNNIEELKKHELKY